MLVVIDLNGNMLVGERAASGDASTPADNNNGHMVVEIKEPIRLLAIPDQENQRMGIAVQTPHPLLSRVPRQVRIACLATFDEADLDPQDQGVLTKVYQEALQAAGRSRVVRATPGDAAKLRRLQSVPSNKER